MKIAIVYNRESQAVINLFGTLNREKYGLETINKIKEGLTAGGHQVKTFEGDKNIITKLEKFMPSVISGERPGLVFNLSYGIQGKGRYMHVPGILEMLGIPYVGSGPETHAIALDKIVTKMILIQKGLPTPKFTVMDKPDSEIKDNLKYPLIVKPKDEAVSFGLKIVHNEEELRDGVKTIYEAFNTPTLVEEYIEGREINVGLLGNNPVEAMPPVELTFGEGLQIYTYEDKKNTSGRTVEKICPAPLSDEKTEQIKQLAIDTFNALGCYDSARVDFRLDQEGNPYILEVNSMASLGKSGSFVYAAEKMGLDYVALVNRLIDVTCERYFGPHFFMNTDQEVANEASNLFGAITSNRDKIEDELKVWTNLSSWTEDPVGLSMVLRKLEDRLKKLGLKVVEEHTNGRSAWTWATKEGLKDGTLLVVPLDIPGERTGFPIPFRTDQEWMYGEGIASSRGGLVTLLSALSALKGIKALSTKKVGVLFYSDEGRGMRYSSPTLRQAAKQAKQVIVLQPGFEGGNIVDQRRGTKKYSIVIEGEPLRVGRRSNQIDVLTYFLQKTEKLKEISSPDQRLTVAIHDVHSERYSVLLPHRVRATVYVTFLEEKMARDAETQIKEVFKSNARGMKTYVEKLEERPPLLRKKNNPIVKRLGELCEEWNIPFGIESSLLATAAGEVPSSVPVICGFGPASKGLYTPNEAIHRGEMIQRSFLLSMLLLEE
ncbi:D-alanine--D-alanine ligase domain protein [Alkaliphilus metalliredigens QYMF]|uniref:D-alanine--D-alanine ligase domain protein n=1 Tax=Alkaliphilus metalliredigens (strain QYMF) TaxID=293826 RepID=A6TUJ5_ALKMQ|nr:M20/M25/M40 family metallo-hydrolase [Alkaliphilus metalliredigens]ABR49863.1 D-alanine--D-alanine ligase domain protein [Alkaliphilus metalliredigens QYMF]